MKIYKLDGNEFNTRDDAYEYMAKELNLPEYFGNNLDALWDSLSMLDETEEIQIVNAREIPRQLGDYGLNILDVFGDLEEVDGINIKIYW